jgi:hypothetical protein
MALVCCQGKGCWPQLCCVSTKRRTNAKVYSREASAREALWLGGQPSEEVDFPSLSLKLEERTLAVSTIRRRKR